MPVAGHINQHNIDHRGTFLITILDSFFWVVFSELVVSEPFLCVKSLFDPDLSLGGVSDVGLKELVLTYQAGVCKKTWSMVLPLAATGTVLRCFTVVLELRPARPVGAITCHPSFTGAWLLPALCRSVVLDNRSFSLTTGCRSKTHNAHLNTPTPTSTASALSALPLHRTTNP